MLVHLFMFRWRESASEADKAKAVADIQAFEGRIAGLRRLEVGLNTSPKGNGFGLGCAMAFDDKAAFSACEVHSLHQAFVDWVLPLVETVDVDFEA